MLKKTMLFVATLPAVLSARAERVVGNSKVGATGLMLLGSAGGAMAQATDPTTPEEAVTSGRTTVIAIIAVGGLSLVLIALASVGWGTGVKFIKRLRGAA